MLYGDAKDSIVNLVQAVEKHKAEDVSATIGGLHAAALREGRLLFDRLMSCPEIACVLLFRGQDARIITRRSAPKLKKPSKTPPPRPAKTPPLPSAERVTPLGIQMARHLARVPGLTFRERSKRD